MKLFARPGALALALILAPAWGAAYDDVLIDKSRITFTSRQMGVPVEGSFRKFSASIAFDPDMPEAGKAAIEIDLNSIDTGSEEADTEVKRKAWFDTRNFPIARFESTSVKPAGNGRYAVAGRMTIKGRSQDVVAPFTLTKNGRQARVEGSVTIKRLQFAIGEGPWADTSTVADDVLIKFEFVVAATASRSAFK